MLRKGINGGPLKRMFVFYSLEKKKQKETKWVEFFRVILQY